MTNDMQKNQHSSQADVPFGAKLIAARESLGLSRKEAGARLRLSEKVILMMEDNNYPADLPITFIRGYIRTYGSLLQLSDLDIQQALEPIQPKVDMVNIAPVKTTPPLTSSHYYMKGLTSVIVFTLMALVAAWWYSHPNSASINEPLSTPAEQPALNNTHAKNDASATLFSPVTTNSSASSNQPSTNLVKQSSVSAGISPSTVPTETTGNSINSPATMSVANSAPNSQSIPKAKPQNTENNAAGREDEDNEDGVDDNDAPE